MARSANFDGALLFRQIELTLHRVLAAAGDPRANGWLIRAYRTLMAQADTLTDATKRQMFLTIIPHHREIVALGAAQGSAR